MLHVSRNYQIADAADFQSHILGTVLDAADVRLKLGKQANCQHYTRRNLAVYISRQGRCDMYLHELENSRYILENRRLRQQETGDVHSPFVCV